MLESAVGIYRHITGVQHFAGTCSTRTQNTLHTGTTFSGCPDYPADAAQTKVDPKASAKAACGAFFAFRSPIFLRLLSEVIPFC